MGVKINGNQRYFIPGIVIRQHYCTVSVVMAQYSNKCPHVVSKIKGPEQNYQKFKKLFFTVVLFQSPKREFTFHVNFRTPSVFFTINYTKPHESNAESKFFTPRPVFVGFIYNDSCFEFALFPRNLQHPTKTSVALELKKLLK